MRIVLVGLSGSGKSAVGRILARRLGWMFVDLDREIEAREGRSVPEIFAVLGEEGFREAEARATRELEPPENAVIAVGGGWMARPDLRDAWPGAARIWLRVRPETAALRLAGGGETRPLVEGSDPVCRLRELLARRLPSYGLAEYTVATDGREAEEVAARIEAWIAALPSLESNPKPSP